MTERLRIPTRGRRGGTWGFILDNMLGSDEGFREYLWSPMGGMRYAMGLLRSERYGRYVVTLLFDMYFTVILFKLLFSKVCHLQSMCMADHVLGMAVATRTRTRCRPSASGWWATWHCTSRHAGGQPRRLYGARS